MSTLRTLIVSVWRIAWTLLTWTIAAGFWSLRAGYHVVVAGLGVVRLVQRRRLDGSVTCSSCGADIGPEAALECSTCRFRWWGGLWSPCPGPDCTAPTSSWVMCPHCNYSSTNPYVVGRELPE